VKDGTTVTDQISLPRAVNRFGCGTFACFEDAGSLVRVAILNQSRQTKRFCLRFY